MARKTWELWNGPALVIGPPRISMISVRRYIHQQHLKKWSQSPGPFSPYLWGLTTYIYILWMYEIITNQLEFLRVSFKEQKTLLSKDSPFFQVQLSSLKTCQWWTGAVSSSCIETVRSQTDPLKKTTPHGAFVDGTFDGHLSVQELVSGSSPKKIQGLQPLPSHSEQIKLKVKLGISPKTM